MKFLRNALLFALAVMMIFAVTSCGKKNIEGLTLTVPDGFTESASSPQNWYAPNYPTDGSNIIVLKTDSDPLFDSYTQEVLAGSIEKQYKSGYNIDVDITVVSFDKSKTDGISTIKMEISYELNGSAIKQLQYMYNASNAAYTVTFTQTGDAKWMDAFKTSAETIAFVK